MKRSELERLVQGMVDGVLDEGQFAQLQQELRENASSRAFYRKSMEIEMLLRETDGVRLPAAATGPRMEVLQRRRRRKLFGRALLAAAATLLVSAAVMHRISIKSSETGIQLSFTQGSSWSGPAAGDLAIGELVKVHFGVAEIDFPKGVRGVIEGPASFRVLSQKRLDLVEGRAWFQVGTEGQGFQVKTPRIELTDHGTEFGVVTREDELDEVHVFDGRVTAVSRIGLKNARDLEAGQAARASPVGRWIERETAKDTFLRELPANLPGIRFSFDGPEPLQPDGEHPAVGEMVVSSIGGGAATLVDGIRGKAVSIRSVDDAISTNWPGIGGTAPRTIACWIQYQADTGDFSSVASWGSGDRNPPGRYILMVVTEPKTKARVLRLSLGHDVNFTGSTALKTGQWHHVAAVFRGMRSEQGEMVELYVDGNREQLDLSFSRPPEEDQKIGTIIDDKHSMPLRIGVGPYPQNTGVFRGEVDDLRILPRALDEPEVREMMAESHSNG